MERILNSKLKQLLTLACTLFLCMSVQVAFAQPANDLCGNAEAFGAGGGMGSVPGTTVGAGQDATPFCGTPSTSPGVWYTFTAEDDGSASLETCGAAFDSKISVYTGSCAALSCVIGNDDACGLQSRVTFPVTNGTSYLVHVHGFGGANGPFDLTYSLPQGAAPPDADCDNPAPLSVVAEDVTICPGDSADLCITVIGGQGSGGGGNAINSTPYGHEALGNNFFSTDFATGNYANIAPLFATNFGYTGAVCVDDVYYAYDNNELNTIDVTTGTATAIGTGTLVNATFVQDMAWDPTTGTVYAISTNIASTALYTVDLATGALTLVGIDNTTATAGIFFGIDNSGTAYLTDIVDDATYQLDLTTGQNTLVGALGVNLNFAQSGDFDPVTNTFYAYIFNLGTFSTQFGTIDTGTGAFSLISDQGFTEVTAFAACAEFAGGGGEFTYQWDPADGLDDPTSEKPRSGIDQTTTYTVTVTDACGQTATDDLTVTVAYDVQALACNDLINVTLDTLCSATITADMLLEDPVCGNLAYDVVITDQNGNQIGDQVDARHVGQRLQVSVRDPFGILSCWGEILVEDKTDPKLECDCEGGVSVVSGTSGTLESPDPQFDRPTVFPPFCFFGGAANHFYDTYEFEVSAAGSYTFTCNGPDDPYGLLYINSFDPTNVCGNLIAGDDDGGPGFNPQLVVTLQPNTTYILVTSTFGANATATYMWDFMGQGQVLNTAPCEVFCFEDVPNLTPTATDACGIASLTSTDQVIDGGDCAESRVIRTWVATDIGGNTTTCTQEFVIKPGTLAEVEGPQNYDGIDGRTTLLCENRCGDAAETADTRFCGPTDLYWNVIPDGQPYAGHPSPDDGKQWGCGQVKCFGTGRPGGANNCGNIQSTFADTRLNICTTGPSEGCYKILRNWTVLDWCTGEVAFFNQVIKVEDNEGPMIADVADIAISVDVWGCEANWLATEPWLMDNCSSEPLDYTVSSTGGTVQALPDGRYRILDLVPGQYDVTYSATDCCGNVTDSTITLTVLDDVAPVAVCDAHTVVSISRTTNINDENLGLTKIFASTFDDGSFDNCSDQVWFKAIRMDEYDSNGNGKFPETVRDGDWASIDCDAANGDDDLRTRPSFYNGPQSYFDDYVKFCCEDITDGPIMVVFRVYDVDPEPFTFGRVFPQLVPAGENPDDYNGVLPEAQDVGGALYGRYDDCMVEVSVQDKLPPYVVAPPNITVTCDYWFPFDADNPNDYTDELDAIFGKVVEGSADPADRDSIVITDRVCPAHPRFAEFAPANPIDDQCYDDKYDIFWGFDGYVLDNCSIELEQTIVPDLHCGRGDIIRSWRAGDDAGNWSNIARQRITIIDCKEFFVPTVCWRFTQKDIGECVRLAADDYRVQLIEWPCDVEISRCQTDGADAFLPENLPIPFDQDRRPRFDDDNCNLLGATYEDRTFTFVDNACVKIFRDWTVIDWCLYEDGVTPFEWHFTQVIKLLNTEGPTFDDCEDKEFCGFGDPAFPNNNQCVGEVTLEPIISDDCTDTLRILSDYKIDAFNDGTFDILGYSSNHPVNPFGIGVSARVYDPASPNANGKYPVGEHRILWTAEDGCGNITACEYLFTVRDCKPPTPYCRNGVSTIPMPQDAGGYVDIWASDYNIGSYDNCTAQDDLIYSFSDDPTDNSRRFFCADAPGIYNLTVYVWDLGLDGLPRNFATCEVTIQLTDCGNQTTYNVAGAIETEAGIEASDVMVAVTGDMTTDATTDNSGTYGFVLDADRNYVVAPEKDVDHRNGVSTFDLVLISKHITGQQALNSPYKMIAADVNNTGSITTFDIIELRKLILYINTEFPDNSSWRFIPSSFNFADANNPFASTFPEAYDINGLDADMIADFVAIKVGDVNESARANALYNPSQTRSAGELNFEVKDQLLNAGASYTVDFTAADFANILGYQFTLNYSDAVEVTAVTGSALDLNEGNFGELNGAITTSWNGAKAANLSADEVVFSVELTAKDPIAIGLKLSDVLNISSDYTTAEAYNGAGVLNVGLNFNTNASDAFALYQNQPNPFTANTVIGFNLPQAGAATLSIYDVAGKVLRVIEGEYSKGYNEIAVNRSELNGAGVLYYTLETQNESATKKMILIK